jgi:hypothetical protein
MQLTLAAREVDGLEKTSPSSLEEAVSQEQGS